MPEIEVPMIWTGRSLEPATEFAAEDMGKLKANRQCLVRVKTPRSVRQHNLAWGLADFLAKNYEGFTDKEHAMDVLKTEARHVSLIYNPRTGETEIKPKSIAFGSLDQMAFNRIFERFIWIVLTLYLPDLEEEALRQHLLEMVGGKQGRKAA